MCRIAALSRCCRDSGQSWFCVAALAALYWDRWALYLLRMSKVRLGEGFDGRRSRLD